MSNVSKTARDGRGGRLQRSVALFNHELDAPVELPRIRVLSGIDGLALTLTHGHQPVLIDPLLDEVVADGLGSSLTQLEVVVVRGPTVGVPSTRTRVTSG